MKRWVGPVLGASACVLLALGWAVSRDSVPRDRMAVATDVLGDRPDRARIVARDDARDEVVAWFRRQGESEVADTLRALWDYGDDASAEELMWAVVDGG